MPTTTVGRDDGDQLGPPAPSRAGRPAAGRPTLELVAAAAGVSRSTVSRVVNRSPNVRPEVVAVVEQAIERLGYVPNRAARSLAGRHTYAVALLVPENAGRIFADPYFASIVEGISGVLERSEYVLNLVPASQDRAGKTHRYLRSGNVDGALVVSHHAGNTDLRELADALPLVFGGRPTVVDPGAAYWVDVDNVGGARLAAEHLVGLGRRHVGTVTGPADMPAAVDRLEGFRQVLRAYGRRDDLVAVADFTPAGAVAATAALLEREPALDAVFVASDTMARAALDVLAAAGRRVPDDVAVVGYDDSPAATAAAPALTTVAQPSITMGARMTELLLGLLAGHRPEHRACVLPTRLVLRDTA